MISPKLVSLNTALWASIYSNKSLASAASAYSISFVICLFPTILLLTSWRIWSGEELARLFSVLSTISFILSSSMALLCSSNVLRASACALLGHEDILYMFLCLGSLMKVFPWLMISSLRFFVFLWSSPDPARNSVIYTIEPDRLWEPSCSLFILCMILYGSGTAKKSTLA